MLGRCRRRRAELRRPLVGIVFFHHQLVEIIKVIVVVLSVTAAEAIATQSRAKRMATYSGTEHLDATLIDTNSIFEQFGTAVASVQAAKL